MNYIDPSCAISMLRALKAHHFTRGDPVAGAAYVHQKQWGDRSEIITHLRAAVAGIELEDVGAGLSRDFMAAASAASVIGRLPGVRALPPRVRLMGPTTKLRASFATEGSAVPLLVGTYSAVTITPAKITALLVASNEALADDLVEAALAADLLQACADALDSAFLDADIATSITAGAVVIDTSVPTLAELDLALEAAMSVIAQAGSLRTSAWAMSSWLAGRLALVRGTGGSPAYPLIGATGGSLCGLAVLVHDDEPFTSSGGDIALVDGALVGYAAGGAELRTSTNALIEMDSSPTGDSIAPTGASASMVSMFSADSTALLATLRAGWVLRRTGGAALIRGVSL